MTRYLFAVAALLVFSSCRSATDPEPDLHPSGELVALVSGAVNDDFLASGSYPPPGPGVANTFASAHPALPPGMYNVMAIRKRGVVHDVVILELYEMFGPDEYPARGRFQHDRPNHGSTLRNLYIFEEGEIVIAEYTEDRIVGEFDVVAVEQVYGIPRPVPDTVVLSGRFDVPIIPRAE